MLKVSFCLFLLRWLLPYKILILLVSKLCCQSLCSDSCLVPLCDPASGWSICIYVYLENTVSFVLIFPFISFSSIWHIFSFCSPVILHLFPEWRMSSPSERVAEVVPTVQVVQSPGHWRCSCSLDPTTGRLQRPSGKQRAVHKPWDTCFWTYPLGCFTSGQLGSCREPRGRWGGWKRG